MSEISRQLSAMGVDEARTTDAVLDEIQERLSKAGFTPVETNQDKPWGGFIRLADEDGNRFLDSFFPSRPLPHTEADNDIKLTPLVTVVAPESRTSFHFHERRVERVRYLTDGGFFRSFNNNEDRPHRSRAEDVVHFDVEQRHRLVGSMGHHTLLAEIWHHTDPNNLSDEDDIIRLKDDYDRV